ncbi:hypothetical protein tb265_11920 [Gemmatimonadetes bacterium T265]|nr:hypothetical protein tb265_11920 [Gemmatimonadetes bacterium T265]
MRVADGHAPLACDGVVVGFPGAPRPALAGVTLVVRAGTVCGLVGRNGAGKSTLIRTAAGLVVPDAGTVRVFGRDPARERVATMCVAGFLLADPALFAYLTAAETLAFVAECHGTSRAAARARAAALIDRLDLHDVADGRAAEYSTGTAKRLAVAAALAHDPGLLVLDEPFEALDPLAVRALRAELRARADAGTAVLVSSHLLAAVESLCDDVVLLERGRVLAGGTVAAVVAALAPAAERTLEGAYVRLVGFGGGAGTPGA